MVSSPMRTTFTFHTANQLIFGRGAVDRLGEVAKRLGARQVFLVTDQVLVKSGAAESACRALHAGGAAPTVFDGGVPEPPLELADACAAEARQAGADLVLGLGGGSNMDLAKIVAVLLAHGRQARDYVGDDQIPGPIAPVVCVPTTAGTGSEVSGATVLTDAQKQMKLGILSNYLRPKAAVVDPLLTVSCPKKVTADSGIDALTHAIEAYTAVDNEAFPLPEGERTIYQGRHPLGDLLAERAIALIGRHLRRAVAEPTDLEAREAMALGATLAGMAFSNVGVAAVHALEYPVGGATHCSHGAGNGLLLPYVMRFNLPARVERFARIAELLAEPVQGLPAEEAAQRAVGAVERLRSDIGIPGRLRELGVAESQLPLFAERAFAVKRILRVNPRVVTVEDLLGILRAAW
jgi:alcohol dehydrogenase class IV